MLLLKNISQSRIWGSERMKSYGAETADTGSVYSVSATKEINCGYFDLESNQTGTLFDLISSNPGKMGLKSGEVYPLIVDMLGADKDLSIQVHPQDSFAKKLGFDYGKTESWYFLEAPSSGSVYGGIKKDKIATLNDDTLVNCPLEYVDEVSAEAGDYLFVPNGTVHAIRAGSLVYEIQQATDITYRIYDYDRKGLDNKPRQLHIREAIENLVPENRIIKKDFQKTGYVDEVAYNLQLIKFSSKYKLSNESAIASVFTILTGNVEVGGHKLSPGNSIMLLPGESVSLEGASEGILATPKPYWRK